METVLTLEPTTMRELGGLIVFNLDLWVNGKVVENWKVNSGNRNTQILLTYTDPKSIPGNNCPIPEGRYKNGKLEFAGPDGAFDFVGSWGPGLGEFWADIIFVDKTGKFADHMRRAFGYHWDENRRSAPGSKGCIVFETMDDVVRFVEMMRKYDPKYTVVNYGLGTVDEFMPTQEVSEPLKPITRLSGPVFRFHPNGASMTVKERMVLEPGVYPIGTPPEGWTLSIGEKKN